MKRFARSTARRLLPALNRPSLTRRSLTRTVLSRPALTGPVAKRSFAATPANQEKEGGIGLAVTMLVVGNIVGGFLFVLDSPTSTPVKDLKEDDLIPLDRLPDVEERRTGIRRKTHFTVHMEKD